MSENLSAMNCNHCDIGVCSKCVQPNPSPSTAISKCCGYHAVEQHGQFWCSKCGGHFVAADSAKLLTNEEVEKITKEVERWMREPEQWRKLLTYRFNALLADRALRIEREGRVRSILQLVEVTASFENENKLANCMRMIKLDAERALSILA